MVSGAEGKLALSEEHVDLSRPCLIWSGYISPGGYGVIRSVRGNNMYVHRTMWQDTFGEIPDGLVIRHLCNNSKCYNIHHLMPGTQKQNSQDMVRAGRNSRGEHRPHSKLTEKQVLEIKNSPASIQNIQLAKQFNVSDGLICGIRLGKRWKHVVMAQQATQVDAIVLRGGT